MKFRFDKNVTALLEGSIDIHIHSAPDVYPRLLNDVELALSAKENGMRAILVKNHYFETAGRARLATDVADFPVFGGIALNLTNGGLNKHAVKMALKMGAKEVWMPTVHADYFVKNKSHVANLATEIGADVQGLVLFKEDGTLKDELFEIFDIIKEADAILATGHVTKEEAKLAVREAAKRGVKKIIVTHPAATFVHYSVDDMKEILDSGRHLPRTHMERRDPSGIPSAADLGPVRYHQGRRRCPLHHVDGRGPVAQSPGRPADGDLYQGGPDERHFGQGCPDDGCR